MRVEAIIMATNLSLLESWLLISADIPCNFILMKKKVVSFQVAYFFK
ncbi:hypothetical protein HanIR_Chr15g0769771 [Helianthus annuus]|nr:hypothetical protein HanIR_Chr15g0769771 [Helianthus annuus]